MPDELPIDYRKLLIAYMSTVVDQEGDALLNPLMGGTALESLSGIEVEELHRIERELSQVKQP